ncbi:hypothetical protein Fot_25480 [Forsythia ovata]|uniref:Uncharacterized protein n=1 Tax=Forsythia ovata TaxID=205694 RepID=A0ABD1U998_9LAMI
MTACSISDSELCDLFHECSHERSDIKPNVGADDIRVNLKALTTCLGNIQWQGQRPQLTTRRFAVATDVPLTSTPPLALVVSPPPSAALPLLSPPAPSSSVPQSTAATSEVPFTTAIPTQITSQVEFDEDTGSDHGTGSQSGSEDISRESPQTGHLE